MKETSHDAGQQRAGAMDGPFGDRQSLARAITVIENGLSGFDDLLNAVNERLGRAHVIGFTGPPGVGKSTLIDACIGPIRGTGQSVAIIAIDPSSEISGGAILGDRLRMPSHTQDDGVFIRSVAARGQLGGVSAATVNIINLFDAAGWDKIIVETVGAGQSETDISRIAHTTIVVQAPGYGDGVQAIKAGLLELADILVVNKCDLPDSEAVASELNAAVSLRHTGRKPPVLQTSTQDGAGVEALIENIETHRQAIELDQELKPADGRNRHYRARLIGNMVEQGFRGSAPSELNAVCENIERGRLDGPAMVKAIVEASGGE